MVLAVLALAAVEVAGLASLALGPSTFERAMAASHGERQVRLCLGGDARAGGRRGRAGPAPNPQEPARPPIAGIALAASALALPAIVGSVILRPRRRHVAALLLAPLLVVVAVRIGLALWRPVETPVNELAGLLPDQAVYAYHATLGDLSNGLGLSPEGTALEWVKAASHADSASEQARAARGIAEARARSGGSLALDAALCEEYAHGSDPVRDAVTQAGARCQ